MPAPHFIFLIMYYIKQISTHTTRTLDYKISAIPTFIFSLIFSLTQKISILWFPLADIQKKPFLTIKTSLTNLFILSLNLYINIFNIHTLKKVYNLISNILEIIYLILLVEKLFERNSILFNR